MSGELEAAGAAATAGLVAAAIDKGEGHGAVHGPCANCGAEVNGKFCAACGQPAHVHRSLLHLIEETLHGLFHFDTKAWRTLPRLIFQPGQLTRDFIDGKRVRYVSPLALFLFTVFLMYFAFAFVGGKADVNINGPDGVSGASAVRAMSEARADIEADLARARAEGDEADVRALESVLASMSAAVAAEEERAADDVGAAEGGVAGSSSAISGGFSIGQDDETGDVSVNTGDPKRDEKIRHALENPELTIYKLQQTAYKFAFLLIPISLPFISLLFLWKRGVTLFDHTVFALYSLSFMSLLFLSGALLLSLSHAASWLNGLSPLVMATLIFVPPVHIFFHLGGTYRLGWFSALWRTFALLTICGAAFVSFLILIVTIGVFG